MTSIKEILHYKKQIISSFGKNESLVYNYKPYRRCGSTSLHLECFVQQFMDNISYDSRIYDRKVYVIYSGDFVETTKAKILNILTKNFWNNYFVDYNSIFHEELVRTDTFLIGDHELQVINCNIPDYTNRNYQSALLLDYPKICSSETLEYIKTHCNNIIVECV